MAEEKVKPSKKYVESKDFRTVYVNTFSVRFGDNDVSLLLSAELSDQKDGVFIQNEVRAMMTPRGAKVLSIVLSQIISEYESAKGPITLPAGKEVEIAESIETPKNIKKPA